MARVLVTGSTDGLGLASGRWLAGRGHLVTWHARSEARAADLRAEVGDDARVVVGDLASLEEVRSVAAQAAAAGPHDAAIHNAGVGFRRPGREVSRDGHELHLAVNVLAPFVLTALVPGPRRLVYLSSGMHRGGTPDLDDVQWLRRPWRGTQAYSDSKLLDVVLAMALARRWPAARAHAVEPGWVATRMGGPGAPDDLEAGAVTQAWLAAGEDPATDVSGGYWYHQARLEAHPAAHDVRLQDALVKLCASLTGVELPADPP